MKTCAKCGSDRPLSDYCKMKSSADGLHCWCRPCRREYLRDWRERHPGSAAAAQRRVVTDPTRRREAAARSAAKHPQRALARDRVSELVRRGRIPPARQLACTDCGKPAAQYDHARGYEPPNDLYVEPVCHPCHGARSRRRGEHRRVA